MPRRLRTSECALATNNMSQLDIPPQQITPSEYKKLRKRLDKLQGCINARVIMLNETDVKALLAYTSKLSKKKRDIAREHLRTTIDIKNEKMKRLR